MWAILGGGLWRSTPISTTTSSAALSIPWGRPLGMKITDSHMDLFGGGITSAKIIASKSDEEIWLRLK